MKLEFGFTKEVGPELDFSDVLKGKIWGTYWLKINGKLFDDLESVPAESLPDVLMR